MHVAHVGAEFPRFTLVDLDAQKRLVAPLAAGVAALDHVDIHRQSRTILGSPPTCTRVRFNSSSTVPSVMDVHDSRPVVMLIAYR